MLKPLLTAKDLTEEITLKEYYEYNQIDLHFFTVEMNSFQKIDVSHKTHPNFFMRSRIRFTNSETRI